MTSSTPIPTPRPSAATAHLVDALRIVEADRVLVRHALCELWRVLGPEPPSDLSGGARDDWAEALRIVQMALGNRTTPTAVST